MIVIVTLGVGLVFRLVVIESWCSADVPAAYIVVTVPRVVVSKCLSCGLASWRLDNIIILAVLGLTSDNRTVVPPIIGVVISMATDIALKDNLVLAAGRLR